MLRAGGIVCIPTESSYGLAVDAGNPDAIEGLLALKERSDGSAIGLIAGSIVQAKSWSEAWPDAALKLADEHWPGPLTLVLPPKLPISKHLLGPSQRVAIRVSSVLELRELALALGNPITATSANAHGCLPAQNIAAAKEYFGEGIGHYLEGGNCTGEASTLVDFDDSGSPLLLRQGPIKLVAKSD